MGEVGVEWLCCLCCTLVRAVAVAVATFDDGAAVPTSAVVATAKYETRTKSTLDVAARMDTCVHTLRSCIPVNRGVGIALFLLSWDRRALQICPRAYGAIYRTSCFRLMYDDVFFSRAILLRLCPSCTPRASSPPLPCCKCGGSYVPIGTPRYAVICARRTSVSKNHLRYRLIRKRHQRD